VADRRRYELAVQRAAQHLAAVDLDCTAVQGCADAIALWSGRRLPEGHRWAGHRLYPPRTQSRAWSTYWRAVEHARRQREGLRNSIVTLNEGLVIHYVQSRDQWKIRDHDQGRSCLAWDDLLQHGREGLMVAASRYDPNKVAPRTGRLIRFSTYATWWIRHHVDRAYQQGAAQIRLPLDVQVSVYKLSRVLDQGEHLTLEQLAQRARLTPAKARKALSFMGWRVDSLDAPVGREEGRTFTLADLVPDDAPGQDEALDRERVAVRLLALLDGLDPESQAIVGELYGFGGDPQTPQQIARRRQVPRERVDQIHTRALASLRGALQETRA
jgi:RNA polymerase primary sigma factor